MGKKKKRKKQKKQLEQKKAAKKEIALEQAKAKGPEIAEKLEQKAKAVEKKTETKKAKTERKVAKKCKSGMSWGWLTALAALFAVALGIVYAASTGKVKIDFSSAYWTLLSPVPVITGMILALLLAKLFYQFTVSFNLTAELQDSDNPAVGLCTAGFLMGVALALIAAVCHRKLELSWEFVKDMLFDGALALLVAVVLLRIAGIIHDKFLLYRFSIAKEIEQDRNLGTGAVCCGAFIATGLILMGSYSAESHGPASYFASVLGSFVLGQVVFVLGGLLFQKATDYDLHYQIGERDNAAAGVIFGSFLVGLGLVVSAAVSGITISTSDWKAAIDDLLFCTTVGIAGIVYMLGVGLLAAKLIFPRVSIAEEVRQKNAAVAFVLAAIYLAAGLIVQSLI